MRTESTSSSDDSEEDIAPACLKNKRMKMDNHSLIISEDFRIRKERAMNTDGISYSESGSECGTSDSSTCGSYYRDSVLQRKTPVKQRVSEDSPDSLLKGNNDVERENFLQDESCAKLHANKNAIRLFKCRECFKSTDTNQYSCRFYKFRKLRRTNKGFTSAEFATPFDATQDEVELWLPTVSEGGTSVGAASEEETCLNSHIARFILTQVGDQFCDLLHQEQSAMELALGDDKKVAWKKPMQGVREMCDVCKTTLFNFHWVCGRCGFVVCIDCYKVRKNGTKKNWVSYGVDQDEWKWLKCNNRNPHELGKLMMCQTIAKDCLQELGILVHDVRKSFGIPQACDCELSQKSKPVPGLNEGKIKELVSMDPLGAIISYLEKLPGRANDSTEHEAQMVRHSEQQRLPDEIPFTPVDLSTRHEDSSSDSDTETPSHSSLRDILMPGDSNGSCSTGSSSGPNSPLSNSVGTRRLSSRGAQRPARPIHVVQVTNQNPIIKSICKPKQPKISKSGILDDVISCFDEKSGGCDEKGKVMQHFIRRYQFPPRASQNHLPSRVMTSVMSKELYHGVPHSWLCEGRLLRLIDPGHSGNYRMFQDQWRRGQPVIVGNMTKLLNMKIWHPDSFCKDFGEDRNDLVNCATGNVVPNRPMKEFWEGFEHFSKRLKDEAGNPMLLKLKDWPPGEDFAEMLPERFKDLMEALPLAEYTRRTGRLNLASCLPEFFVRPDLGPKMYNAYGSALFPKRGTTNLHLDISDAVNFMVYVGIPRDEDSEKHIQEAFKAIDEAGCDEATRRRVRTPGEMPGALWHIYHASDADKIRDLLNKVAIEQQTRLEPHHDPIHDQSWYLDGELRDRLYREYNVTGYAIVQCLGDAVFIPAGAPHQVRNLHNCVKVAEDFVSPENVSQCFHLTQEFRELSDTHTNHEDKLQIKNIIYHTIKSAVSLLLRVGRTNSKCTSIHNSNGIKEEVVVEKNGF